MRGITGIVADNSPSSIVMKEAIKRGDYDTIDLLSCGSGYDVTEMESIAYMKDTKYSFFEGSDGSW